MKRTRIQTIEEYKLSNGDTVRVTKHGRQYNFVRLFYEDQAPDWEECKNLDHARTLLAEALRQDVLELD